ncbi:MAG: hypothetical protein ACHQ1H_01820, partial [Nitrososphaerales archaeon]
SNRLSRHVNAKISKYCSFVDERIQNEIFLNIGFSLYQYDRVVWIALPTKQIIDRGKAAGDSGKPVCFSLFGRQKGNYLTEACDRLIIFVSLDRLDICERQTQT